MDNNMNGEQLMRDTQRAALKKIRDEFQAKYPHYTPPPDATREQWAGWIFANMDLHGPEGFAERFPSHHVILQRDVIDPEAVHDALHNLAYPTQPRHTARECALDLVAG